MRDTPETDAKACRTAFSDGFHSVESCPADKGSWVDIDFARKLERERNEAREQTKACVLAIEALTDGYGNLTAERDQLRKVADELADKLSSEVGFNSCLVNSYYQLPHVKQKESKI